MERLQKILSQAGIASRRKAEEMILAGQVSVNGQVITELGSKAELGLDHIKVNGKLLHAPRRHVYFVLNKPKGCVTTVSDPQERKTVMEYMRGVKERVFPVGRLDYASEGLLLLTNDGEFAHRITSPASHVMKTYHVKVTGPLTLEQEEAFRVGVPLHGRKTAPAEVKRIKQGANPWYEVRIAEGRQNQIRMMFKHFGRLVEKLRRVKIGFLKLDLAPSRFRPLTTREVEQFRKVLRLDQAVAEDEGKDRKSSKRGAGRRGAERDDRAASEWVPDEEMVDLVLDAGLDEELGEELDEELDGDLDAELDAEFVEEALADEALSDEERSGEQLAVDSAEDEAADGETSEADAFTDDPDAPIFDNFDVDNFDDADFDSDFDVDSEAEGENKVAPSERVIAASARPLPGKQGKAKPRGKPWRTSRAKPKSPQKLENLRERARREAEEKSRTENSRDGRAATGRPAGGPNRGPTQGSGGARPFQDQSGRGPDGPRRSGGGKPPTGSSGDSRWSASGEPRRGPSGRPNSGASGDSRRGPSGKPRFGGSGNPRGASEEYPRTGPSGRPSGPSDRPRNFSGKPPASSGKPSGTGRSGGGGYKPYRASESWPGNDSARGAGPGSSDTGTSGRPPAGRPPSGRPPVGKPPFGKPPFGKPPSGRPSSGKPRSQGPGNRSGSGASNASKQPGNYPPRSKGGQGSGPGGKGGSRGPKRPGGGGPRGAGPSRGGRS